LGEHEFRFLITLVYVALWARKCFFASDGLRWFMFNLVF